MKSAFRMFLSLVVAPLLLLSTAGCSLTKSASSYQLPMAELAPAAGSVTADEDYRLASGDGLTVKFLYHDELNASPQVREDGRITVPGLGDFDAAGFTTEELAADVYRRASLTYRNPNVSIIVTKRVEQRAYIGGEVRRPGYVPLRPGLTSLRAIFERGGFLDSAKIDNVLHIHWQADGRYRARVINLKSVLETGDIRSDDMLGANDVVFVPKTAIANADLWVRQYILDLIPVREPTTRLPEIPM